MKPEDTLVLYHQKQKEINKATLSAEAVEGAKMTRTSYRELQSNGRYSLLEVELHSGRSHQIRAAFAYYQHPLLGDVKYGAKKHRYPYQALCCMMIRSSHRLHICPIRRSRFHIVRSMICMTACLPETG